MPKVQNCLLLWKGVPKGALDFPDWAQKILPVFWLIRMKSTTFLWTCLGFSKEVDLRFTWVFLLIASAIPPTPPPGTWKLEGPAAAGDKASLVSSEQGLKQWEPNWKYRGYVSSSYTV